MPTQLRSCQAISTSNEASTMATFTLMTYNILAQALIKRELFPNSGNALKWVWAIWLKALVTTIIDMII